MKPSILKKIFFSRKTGLFIGALFFLMLLNASTAHAVQSHGYREGIVAHLIGHVLFIIGASSLLFRIYTQKWTGPGWPQFKSFLWLIIFWNCLTAAGHWLKEFETIKYCLGSSGNIECYHATGLADYIFYASRLDNLILLPAIIFLLLALKKWTITDST